MSNTVLGEGSFGIIIKSKHPIHGITAVKIIAFRKGENGSDMREVKIAQKVKHPNVLQYLKYTNDNDLKRYPVTIRKLLQQKFLEKSVPLSYFHVHMEFCNAGSLQDWIVSVRNRERNLETADRLFSQILEAVAAIHKDGIVHGDLKPQNIFLHKITDSDTIIKVGDFGDSFMEVDGPHRQEFGTPLYKEKPKYSNEKITRKYDINSLGLIYSILFMGSFPKCDEKLDCNDKTRQNILHNLLKKIKNCESSKLMKDTYPEREHFVKQLIADDRRPDANQAKDNFLRIVEKTNYKLMSSSVPGKIRLFQGRQPILQQINKNSSIYILLYGLTGTGKKTIASEFLHSKSESNTFQEALWFNCSSRKILKRQYRDLQAEKKLKEPSLLNVLNWLNSQPKLAIVYENVHDFLQIQDLIAADRSCGLVICTSRINSNYWPEYFYKIKVDFLPGNDCSHLIYETVEIINNQIEMPTKEEIAAFNSACIFLSNNLGHSTTAIAHILVYLRTQNNIEVSINSISKYVKDCQQGTRKLKQMQHDVIKLAKIETKLLPTISQLNAASSMACKWLKICAYLDSQLIPEFMFDNFLVKDNGIQLKNEILALLRSYSLVEYRSSNNGSFSVSRIVQRTVQMNYGSSFGKTIQSISSALSIPHLNGKGTTKTYSDSVYKVRTLQPHYESILSHVSEYKDPLISCCLPSSKKDLKKIQFSFQKALMHSYKSQSLLVEKDKALDEMLNLKEDLYGNNSPIRGTTLMAKAKHLLSSIMACADSDESKIDDVKDLFHEAKKVLQKCYNENQNRIEIYQCYLYQAECYTVLPKRYWKIQKDSGATGHKKRKEIDYMIARYYLNKALKVILAAIQKQKNLLLPLCTTLKKIAEIYSYLGDWKMMEKYLLLAFEFCLLEKIDNGNDNLKFLHQVDTFIVSDEQFENTLNKWTCNPGGAINLLKTFSRCYKRHNNPIKAKFVEEIHKQCKLKASPLEGAYLPNFGKLQKLESAEKCYETIVVGLQSLENKEQKLKFKALAVAQNKISQADIEKRQRKIKDAIDHYNEGLNVYLEQKNANDLSIAFVYEKLGECYVHYADSEKACEMFEKCYKIFKSDPVMKKDTNIKFAKVIQKYAKQLPGDKIQEKISLLEECLPILISYYKKITRRCNEVDKSRNEVDKSHNEVDKSHNEVDKSHNEVAFIKEKIGSLYMKLGNFNQAEEVLKEALETYEKKLPLGNQNRISCLEKLYKTCEKRITYRYEGDEAETYKKQYDIEVTLKNQVNGNDTEKSKLLQKTKRKKVARDERKVESIMKGTFK